MSDYYGQCLMSDIATTATRKRLDDINHELNELREERDRLKAHWELEKQIIQKIQSIKAEIEQQKIAAADYERQGNFGKVAEIRYGIILQLEKDLASSNQKLTEIQGAAKMLKEEVDAEDIAEIVAKWTGVPVQRMLESERLKLLHIEERLGERVIAQSDAIHAIANSIRRSRAGLQDANRPIGSFIFLGSTGVGKTETARALAEFLFDDESAMIRIDMSEYMEKHAVSRLVGAPPGYVGYEEGGQLTEAVRRRPYAVVLLDEIEKAHPDVFNVLLQVLDDGRLTDSKGRSVNFKNTIVIMTSNLGTEFIQDKMTDFTDENRDEIMGSVRGRIIDLLRSKMRPEFLNRIDEIILFQPLTRSDTTQIARIQIQKLAERLELIDIKIIVTEDALDWLTRVGYDAQYGARPLKRAVQRYFADPLAAKILAGDFSANDTIIAKLSGDSGIAFSKQ